MVVLIDDSVDVHRLLKARLRTEAVELAAFADGREGVDFCIKNRPALVLLDLDMPGMDGYAVLRALRADPATVNTSVVMLSGLTDSQDKVAAFDLGATDYVTKPFDFSELRARVRSALRTQRLLQLLAERAEVDGLTGLANRAAFNRRWSQEVSEALRYGRPLSLAVMDIDHFKKINDTYGHPAGDEVIQGFAKVITSFTRDCDISCRYGGEEFCIIMPETAPDASKIVGERIREAMAGTVWARHPEHNVTVSVGIAGVNGGQAGLTAEAWLERADKALYNAKHTGRNRVIVDVISTDAPLKMAG